MDDSQATGGQEPKKYIRTFAGDLEMAEKASTPSVPPPPPIPPPPVLAPPPPEQPPPVPLQPVAPKPQPVAVQEKSAPLQTYASDFSDHIKKTSASRVTILAAEQDSLPPPPTIPAAEPSRVSLSYVAVGVALVALSVVGIYLAYRYFTNVAQPVAPVPAVPAPILVDEREELAGTGTELLRAIIASAARPIATGAVRFLYTTSSTDAVPVFAELPLAAPDELVRNVRAKGSMSGVIAAGGNQSPFFILSVSAYGTVFSALLAWEPLMPIYLNELFPPFTTLTPSPFESTSASSTATTTVAFTLAASTSATTTLTTPLQESVFADATVASHDVRAYQDPEGRTLFLYGFWNQETLIIARDSNAFAELVNRLATARTP